MNDFGLELAEILTKAEALFDLSKILQNYYSLLEQEIFTINFRRSDGTLISCSRRQYSNSSQIPQYYWIKEENIENTERQPRSTNTCPPAVMEVLIKAAIVFDLSKVLQASRISTREPERFVFEIRAGNTILAAVPLRCPCPFRPGCCLH